MTKGFRPAQVRRDKNGKFVATKPKKSTLIERLWVWLGGAK